MSNYASGHKKREIGPRAVLRRLCAGVRPANAAFACHEQDSRVELDSLGWAEPTLCVCLLCELPDVPVEVLLSPGGWQLAHMTAKARGGRKIVDNLFPCHSDCNFEQGMRSLDEVRGKEPPVPAMNIDEAREEMSRMHNGNKHSKRQRD